MANGFQSLLQDRINREPRASDIAYAATANRRGLAAWWQREIPDARHRGALRRFTIGALPELRARMVQRGCPKWESFSDVAKAGLLCCPCGRVMPQDVRHALFECAYTAPARAAAVRAMSRLALSQGTFWGGLSALKKFNAMLAPRCLPGLDPVTSTLVRRAGVSAWVTSMDSGCRPAIVASNTTFPRDVALRGREISGAVT